MNHSNSSTFSSEVTEFSKFARTSLLFAVPFVLAAVLVVVVDPYDFIPGGSLVSTDVKFPIAGQHDPCFWTLNQYRKDHSPHLLLGDSRIAGLDVALIEQLSGNRYANLGYGGGSLREALESFALASEITSLRSVTVGISLDKYNDYELVNRAQFYRNVRGNPALYLVNRGVWRSGVDCVYHAWTGKPFTKGRPNVSIDAFWQEQLHTQNLYFLRYVDPVGYRRDLAKLADDCRQRQIDLTFVIFPSHADVRALVQAAGLDGANQKMRQELAALGRVIDLDWSSELTTNRDNFKDPVHLTVEAQRRLVHAIWGKNEQGYARRI